MKPTKVTLRRGGRTTKYTISRGASSKGGGRSSGT